MINALNIIPVKTDSCPKMGDYAIMKKMNRPWKERKRGDLVMFDFNGNGTSDHIALLIKTNKDGSITTIEGNTGSGDDTNGGQVQKRTRYRDQVNYFVRPNYTDEVTADMVIATAEAELGVKESPKNSNKVKYNRWFYGKNIAAFWCCTCMCWLFAHVQEPEKPWIKPKDKYEFVIPKPTLKKGSKGTRVKKLQRFLNFYGNINLKIDGDFGSETQKYTKKFQKAEGLKPDGVFGPKSYAKAIKYLPVDPNEYPDKFPVLPKKTSKIAVKCAYPYGTPLKKYKYEGGKPKPEYKEKLNKAYPKRSHWKYPKSRAGASCDVFAGTVLKLAGYKSAPHTMSTMVAWCRKHLKKVSSLQDGDILTRTNHVMVVVDIRGHKRVANAHFLDHGGTYGIIEKIGKHTDIWRPEGDSCFSLGDTFTDVKKLKKYLNWYGNYGLKITYDFDHATEIAVMDFQAKEGLPVTGEFGAEELKAAKAVTK